MSIDPRLTDEVMGDGPWQTRYGVIGEVVKDILRATPDKQFSPAALVDLILPKSERKGVLRISFSNRLFFILRALAKHDLSDWCERPPAQRKRIMGRWVEVQPYVWRSPPPVSADERWAKCPLTGGWTPVAAAKPVPLLSRLSGQRGMPEAQVGDTWSLVDGSVWKCITAPAEAETIPAPPASSEPTS